MKKILSFGVGLLITTTWATSASAQTPAPAQTPAAQTPKAAPIPGAPTIDRAYAGLITGTGSVVNTSAVVGGEGGVRVWKNLDVFLEGGSLGDVVPQSELDKTKPLTDFLTATQGKPATATIKMPGKYWALGARWVFENLNIPGGVRPYGQFAFGGGKMERQPSFTLGGADITSSLPSYGVILGSDITGDETGAVVSGGAGVLIPYRMIYGDVGFRITSLGTSGDSISVSRFHIGVGVRF